MDDITVVTGTQITDDLVKRLNQQYEQQAPDSESALEGEIVDDTLPKAQSPAGSQTEEQDLKSRITSGEWDNLDDLPAFAKRTPEGQLMARTEALDARVRQLELRLPMLLNQQLHDAYIQVLRKIHALRKTKAALFYFAYKNEGQRDLPGS